MTALFEGFRIVGILVIILTLYIPFITLVLLSKTGIFQSRNEITKAAKYIIVFVTSAALTLIVLRYSRAATYLLLLYTCTATIFVGLNLLLKKAKKEGD